MNTDKRQPANDCDHLAETDLLAPGLIHEMRQPLMGIKAALQLIATQLGPSITSLDEWGMAIGQVGRLEEMFRSYQDFLHPERLTPTSFGVEAVVKRAVDLLASRIRRLGSRFALLVDGPLPNAFGVPNTLLHAITNVLVNALDALEGLGTEARLHVRLLPRASGASPEHLELRISDEGSGVPAELRERIFEPGFTTKPDGKGTGLGLHIARRMLDSLGGNIRLASDDDPLRLPWARTEFCISLPISGELTARLTHEAPQPSPPQPRPAPTMEPALAVPPAADPLIADLALAEFKQAMTTNHRVLVVDDDAGVLKVFSELLPRLGLEFELTQSAEEVLPAFDRGSFNLAIIDKNLPGNTGVDLLRDLHDLDPALEVMMITAFPNTAALLDIFRLGACDYFEKPFEDLDVVAARILATVQRQALRARTARLRRRIETLHQDVLARLPDSQRQALERVLGLLHVGRVPSRVAILGNRELRLGLEGLVRTEFEPFADFAALEQTMVRGDLDAVIVDPSGCREPLSILGASIRRHLGANAWLVASDTNGRDLVLQAMQAGATDFIPLDRLRDSSLIQERVRRGVKRAREHHRDRAIIRQLLGLDIDQLSESLAPSSISDAREPTTGPPSEAKTAPSDAQPKARVLLVEDEEVILLLLEKALRLEGFVVVSAANTEQAIDKLEHFAFDMLVTDKNLPGAGGVEIARVARKKNADMGIILITGYASKDSAEALVELGADDYITKPFDISDLTAKIAPILDRRRQIATRRRAMPKATPALHGRVLVVEANESDRARLSNALGKLGYDVLHSADADRALHETEGLAGAVINRQLCGKDTKTQLFEQKLKNPDFRLLVITEGEGFQDSINVILLGASGHLVRPFSDEAALLGAVRRGLA